MLRHRVVDLCAVLVSDLTVNGQHTARCLMNGDIVLIAIFQISSAYVQCDSRAEGHDSCVVMHSVVCLVLSCFDLPSWSTRTH